MLQKLRNKYRKVMVHRLQAICHSRYEKLDKSEMVLGAGLYNLNSHMNAVQAVEEGKAEEVNLCIYFDGPDFACVHFINKHLGKYVDNTLGWEYEQLDYYIVKQVSNEESKTIWKLLKALGEELTKSTSSVFIRKLLLMSNKEF